MTYNNYYEYEWDSYYCYPNCFILKNKLNIKDENLLDEYLAQTAGYYVDFSKVSSKEMIEASADSFVCNYNKMANMFRKIIEPISSEDQQEFINSIAAPNGILIKTFNCWKR